MDITTWITAISAAVSTIVAIFIAYLTNKTIKAYDEQLRIAKEQVYITQSQTFNQSRPILLHPEHISGLLDDSGKVQLDRRPAIIGGLQNIGTGPAFNIYGVLVGKPLPPFSSYRIWNYDVISPGVLGKEITLLDKIAIRRETTIGSHILHVPDDPEHNQYKVRVTLTYHDIYGRKLASIYDYHINLKWICVGHIENIEHDLYELNQIESARNSGLNV